MAYSRINYVGNGSQHQYAINFPLGFLNREDVACYVLGEVDGLGAQVFRTITWIDDGLVDIGAAPANGATVVFERTVDKDELIHDYADGSGIVEENLDQSNKQNIMLVHEVLDGRFGVLQNDIDMGQFSVKNLADPVDDQDAVNLQFFMANNASENKLAAEDAQAAAEAASTTAGSAALFAMNEANRATAEADEAAASATAAASSAATAALFVSVYTKVYSAGTDFTAGTTTALTLDHAVAKAVLTVTFDGVTQHHNQYNTAGTTLTFTAAIPASVGEVEVVYGIRASSVAWSNVSCRPTTLAGYGITDAATSAGLSAHTGNTSNPHGTTAAQVGAYSTAQTDTMLAAKMAHTGGTATDATLAGTTTLPGGGAVTSTGNVGIGVATPVPFSAGNRVAQVHASTGNADVKLTTASSGTGASAGMLIELSNLTAYLWNGSNGPLVLGVNNGEAGRIAADKTWSIGGAPGSESLRVNPSGSGDYFAITTSSGNVDLYATGATTNANSRYISRGTGQHQFYTGTYGTGVLQVSVGHVAGAVDSLVLMGGNGNVRQTSTGTSANVWHYYSAKGNAGHQFCHFGSYGTASLRASPGVASAVATNGIIVQASGAGSRPVVMSANLGGTGDTDIGLNVNTQGTGTTSFGSHNGAYTQFDIEATVNAVNRTAVRGSATGTNAYIRGIGEASAGINFSATGAASFYFVTGGGTQAIVHNTASATNSVRITGAAAGSAPIVYGAGTDTNVGLRFGTQSAGAYQFDTGSFAATQFMVTHTASAVNRVSLTGSVTGNAVNVAVGGTDTNVGINIVAQNSAPVQLQNGSAGWMFAVGPYGGGNRVAYMRNTDTAVTSNPSGGGYLYVESGALKYRGSSGTVTTIANA